MTRRSTTFLVTACLSAGIHAAVVFLAFPRYEVGGSTIGLPGRKAAPARGTMTLVLEREPAPEPKPKPKPEPEPEPEEEVEDPAPEEFEMGERDATGYASHEIPDRVEATAPEADADQAYLSLDPPGAGGRGRDTQSLKAAGKSTSVGTPGGSPPSPPPPPPPPPPPLLIAEVVGPPGTRALAPFGVAAEMKLPRRTPKVPTGEGETAEANESNDDGLDDKRIHALDAPQQDVPSMPPPAPPVTVAIVTPSNDTTPRPIPPLPVTEPARPIPSQAPVPDPSPTPTPSEAPVPNPSPTPSPAEPGTRAGGSAEPAAADPARASDSESDPFSKLGTATIRDGRLQIRFGRKVKTRRPKLLLAGSEDLMIMGEAKVVLTIAIDETGKVTKVTVKKSSGSNNIDQPTVVAVYDWKFEPKTDEAGQAVVDEIQFTIGWH